MCPDCEKFYEAHGPSEGVKPCTHLGSGRNSLIQQVSRHRARWETTTRPIGFWNSDFPNEQLIARQREDAEKREAVRLQEIAQDVASGNGRWKRTNGTKDKNL